MRQGLRSCRNPFGTCNVRNRPLMQVLVYIYTLAQFKCSVGKNPVSSLYTATKNEIQVSGMAISKKYEQGPQSHLFRNNRLSSDFNVEVKGFDVEVVKYF
jgi:hypothetical protein